MLAKYQVIAQELKEKIQAGELQKQDSLPSELKLQEYYQVSRATVRQALNVLVKEGYIEKTKGAGSFVIDAYQKPRVTPGLKTIGVIMTYLSDYIFPDIIRGIEKELRQQGYGLLLASTNNDFQQEEACLQKMLAYHVDGLIVEPTKSNEFNPNLSYYLSLKEAGIPVVMMNASYEALKLPKVVLDDVLAGQQATDYLLQKGHRHLALLSKTDDLQGKLRLEGFIHAHEKAHLAFQPSAVVPFTTENRLAVVESLAQRLAAVDNTVTGVVCYNDECANLLVEALSAHGKRVPQDISIVGLDDSNLAVTGRVPLTSIAHPKEAMGIACGQWIIEAVSKQKIGADILFTPKIIQRDSVRKL